MAPHVTLHLPSVTLHTHVALHIHVALQILVSLQIHGVAFQRVALQNQLPPPPRPPPAATPRRCRPLVPEIECTAAPLHREEARLAPVGGRA